MLQLSRFGGKLEELSGTRCLDNCSGCLLLFTAPLLRPQVTQQGNLLQGQTIICINLRRLAGHVIPWQARRWLISENPKSFCVEIGESDSRREVQHIPIPPVSGSWKFGSRPLSRNLETFSMFLCCTCSINFFRFA